MRQDRNRSGIARALALTAVGCAVALPALAPTPSPALGPLAVEYTVEDVGFTVILDTAGHPNAFPGLNEAGRVAGASVPAPSRFSHAFRTNAALTVRDDLGTLGGATSDGFDINENGQVAGGSDTDGGAPHAFRYTDGAMPPMLDLRTLGGIFSVGYRLNRSGQVVGQAATLATGTVHPFRFTDGTGMVDLIPDGGNGAAMGINTAGSAVGFVQQRQTQAFRFTDGVGLELLGFLPGGTFSLAYDINDHVPPQSAGEADRVVVSIFSKHAFRHSDAAGMVDLGTLPDASDSRAFALNDQGNTRRGFGRAVAEDLPSATPATLFLSDRHAFLFTDGKGMRDLNSLIPSGSGWVLSAATDINNAGQIVGVGLRDGTPRVFRLTPATGDTQPPTLSNCVVNPTVVGPGAGSVALAVDVTDNAGVARVVALLTPRGGTPTSVALTRSGNTWRGTFTTPTNTGTAPIIYDVVFRAFDTSENHADLPCGTITVRGTSSDTQPPTLTNCVVNPTMLGPDGGPVSLAVDVTDNVGVASVEALLTPRGGTAISIPLSQSSTNPNTWTGTFNAPPNTAPDPVVYDVVFRGFDAAGNHAELPCGTLAVRGTRTDTVPPQLSNCSVTPRVVGPPAGLVLLAATATDNVGVMGVEALITPPGATAPLHVPLAQSGTSSRWSGTFQTPANSTSTNLVYSVVFRATDVSGNTTDLPCGTFVIRGQQDTQAPFVVDCMVDPRLVGPDPGSVSLSAKVTDDVRVASVVALITPPGASQPIQVPLTPGAIWTGSFSTPANNSPNPEDYGVRFRAVDPSGNTSEMDCGTFTVRGRPDTQPPSLTDCVVDPRVVGPAPASVSLAVTATDNTQLATVMALIAPPDGSAPVAVPLQQTGPSRWTGTFRTPANNTNSQEDFAVLFRAQDTSGNRLDLTCGVITVLGQPRDITPPLILDCQATPQAVGPEPAVVTLTATVTDNVGVTGVVALITPPGASAPVSVPLTLSGGVWTGTFATPRNNLPDPLLYGLRFRATDAAGNVAEVLCGSFSVRGTRPDTVPPLINDCRVTPRVLGPDPGSVALSAVVTDDGTVAAVLALITRPGQTQPVMVALTQGANSLWSGTFAVPANETLASQSYPVAFRAFDAAGNRADADCGSFAVRPRPRDTTPPSLSSCSVDPRVLGPAAGSVALAVTANDNVALASVVALVTPPGGADPVAVPLSQGTGHRWTGAFPTPQNTMFSALVYAVTFRAVDTAGNRTDIPCGTFSVRGVPRDTTPPVIRNCRLTPPDGTLPAEGGAVTVEADVTDNTGVSTVVAHIQRVGSTESQDVELTLQTGSHYLAAFTLIPADAVRPAVYDVTLIATDPFENRTTQACGRITVGSPTPPPAGSLGISTRSLSFGNICLGNYDVRSLTLTNTGTGRLTGSVGGLGAPFEVIRGSSAFTLAPGGSQKVTVRFIPRREATFAASLAVASSDPARPTVRISITGKGCHQR